MHDGEILPTVENGVRRFLMHTYNWPTIRCQVTAWQWQPKRVQIICENYQNPENRVGQSGGQRRGFLPVNKEIQKSLSNLNIV